MAKTKKKKKSLLIKSIESLSGGGKKSKRMSRVQSLFTIGGVSSGSKRKGRWY